MHRKESVRKLLASVPESVSKDTELSKETTRAVQGSKVASKLLATRSYQSFTTEELRGDITKMLFFDGKFKNCVVRKRTLSSYIKDIKIKVGYEDKSKSTWLEFCVTNKENLENEINRLEIKVPEIKISGTLIFELNCDPMKI